MQPLQERRALGGQRVATHSIPSTPNQRNHDSIVCSFTASVPKRQSTIIRSLLFSLRRHELAIAPLVDEGWMFHLSSLIGVKR